MHSHLHIVPRWTDDGFHWNWRQLNYESDEAKMEILEKIQKHFKLENQPGDEPAEEE